MNAPDAPTDLALSLPLNGVQLIEASAGTGKTYTIAGLYARLVIERGLTPRDILVVTFTEAASEELKARLRARLQLCAAVAAAEPIDAEQASEVEQARSLVEQALQNETAQALVRRLRVAVLDLDSAPISTIHGFCLRALREQAPFALPTIDGELLANENDLIADIAHDLWREFAAGDAGRYRAFASATGSAQKFSELLPRLLATDGAFEPAFVDREAALRRALAATDAARKQLRASWKKDREETCAALIEHAHAEHFNKKTHSIERVQSELEELQAQCIDGGNFDADLIARYTPEALNKANKKNSPAPPSSPLLDQIASWLAADQAAQSALREWGIELLHDAVARARERLGATKRAARQFSYDDQIRALDDALHGAHGTALAQALHTRFPVALIDEFQDTDARQYAIFAAIYGTRGDLVLIGDPKQAIYRFRGGDVETYLRASQRADQRHELDTNFRSSPAYLAALDHLYTFSGTHAFDNANIVYHVVRAGGKVHNDDLLIDGEPASSLTFWQVEANSNKEKATEELAQATARVIAHWLAPGRAQLRDKRDDGKREYRALDPSDFAVLVNTNDEAYAVQSALAEAGAPSVSVTQRSVFAGEEARELYLLLDALADFDERRLRALPTTLLFGGSLRDYANDESAMWRARLDEYAELRRVALAHGVLAMLERAFEQHASSVLALPRGERRMTNWLQLAELAQAASGCAAGLRGVADWLALRIARADDKNDTEQLRLESDAKRVQIRTIHASKGLEYPIVLLPFASLRRSNQHRYPNLLRYHSDGAPQARYVIDKTAAATAEAQAAQAQADAEEFAERLRTLYVALTRARYACGVMVGDFGSQGESAMLHLLGAEIDKKTNTLPERLAELVAQSKGTIVVASPPSGDAQYRSKEKFDKPAPMRSATRHVIETRSSYSFTRLTDSDAGVETLERAGRDDEGAPAPPVAVADPVLAKLSGKYFGVAFHEILEKVDFSTWRDRCDAPSSQTELLERVLRRHALLSGTREDNTATLEAVARLVARTLNAPLPFGARLADLPPNQYRAEMPFHFSMAGVDSAAWLRAMHAHKYLRDRTRFADLPRLAGLMTGVLDLVVHHAGRWWVIDYKTNLLGATADDYAPARLDTAVREDEYDLQYLIYLTALRRWLKSRLGDAFDYARDVGGALYLFVRGLDAHGINGVYKSEPPAELIEQIDALLAAPRRAA